MSSIGSEIGRQVVVATGTILISLAIFSVVIYVIVRLIIQNYDKILRWLLPI